MIMRQVSLALLTAAWAIQLHAGDWPQWRGPLLNGISPEKNLPLEWSDTANVAWRLPMPDRSGSTPIVSGGNVVLHVAEGQALYLWCVNQANGAPRWKKPLGAGNYKSSKQNMSSPSPVTDGKSVIVLTGTGVLKSFDFDGAELWTRDLQHDYGKFGIKWGYASSPLLYENGLYVQVLHGTRTTDPSYLLRIDKQTGRTVWRVERPTEAVRESHDSYRTPSLLQHGGGTEIVVADGDAVSGHDAATGKELWRARGLNPSPSSGVTPSTVVFNDLIFVPTHIRPMLAFRAGGRGDVTLSHRLWTFGEGPDVSTPVTDGKYFYMVNDGGIMWCLDARTGREIWGKRRLRTGTYSSSLILADGRIYATSEDGVTSVVKAGPEFEVLAENELDGFTLSSPAVSNGHIFIRTDRFLYSIGKR